MRTYATFSILLTLLIAFSFQGRRGLYETTEGRYAECAREMVETGNWVVPQLDYRPHWSKPPLTYWCIASSLRMFGNNEFAVRFPNAVVFVFLMLIISKLGALIWDEEVGIASGIIFATSLFPVVALSSVSTDLLLSFWEALAVLFYWRAYRSRDTGGRNRLITLMWVACGFAFLTKGPPGLLSLLVIIVFHLSAPVKRNDLKMKILSATGVLLFLAIGLSWYILVVMKYRGLLSYYLRDELYSRIFTDTFHRNPQWFAPIVLYLLPLSLGTIPWAFCWKDILASSGFTFGTGTLRKIRADPGAFFCVIWLGLPLVVLSLARSRLLLYVFPFFPASVLLLARGVTAVGGGRGFLEKMKRIAIVSASVLILVKLVSAYVPVRNDMKPLSRLCLSEGTGDVHYVLYRMKDMYGLQFYLQRHLERVSLEHEEWADRDVDELLEEITDSPGYGTYVIIAKEGDDSLKEALDASLLAYGVREDSRYYRLFVVHPPGEDASSGSRETFSGMRT